MTLRRCILQLLGLEPPPGGDTLRLEHAALCVDCETLIPARGTSCIACGGRALLNLKRVLGGIRPEESARLVRVADRSCALPRFLHPQAGAIQGTSRFDRHDKLYSPRNTVVHRTPRYWRPNLEESLKKEMRHTAGAPNHLDFKAGEHFMERRTHE